jgi:hypothetical protein
MHSRTIMQINLAARTGLEWPHDSLISFGHHQGRKREIYTTRHAHHRRSTWPGAAACDSAHNISAPIKAARSLVSTWSRTTLNAHARARPIAQSRQPPAPTCPIASSAKLQCVALRAHPPDHFCTPPEAAAPRDLHLPGWGYTAYTNHGPNKEHPAADLNGSRISATIRADNRFKEEEQILIGCPRFSGAIQVNPSV